MTNCIILDAYISSTRIGYVVVDQDGNNLSPLFSTTEQAEFWCLHRMIDQNRKEIFPDEWKKEIRKKLQEQENQ